MITTKYLQVWSEPIHKSLAQSRRRSSRHSLSLGMRPEILENRTLLAGSPLPGSLDPGFGQGGSVTTNISDTASACIGALQPDGKIVLAAQVDTPTGQATIALVRYQPDGQLDTSFGPSKNGQIVEDPTLGMQDAAAIAIVSNPGHPGDGDIVVAGTWQDPATLAFVSGLARFQPDGSPDSSFGADGSILEPPSSTVRITGPLLIQPGGKILVGGQTDLGTHAPGSSVATVERFNENGSLDSTFAAPIVNGSLFGGLSSDIRGLALDSNGNIVAAGNDDSAASGDVIAVARMTPNGALDPSFGVGGVQTTNVSSIGELGRLTGVAINSSGNVVVGGDLRLIAADQSVYFAARYNSHGTLDASFNHGGIALAIASESPTTFEGGIAVQSGGQVLLGGLVQITFTTPGVESVVALCRLNEDGSPDTGFGDAGEVIEDFGLPRNTQEFSDFGSVLVQPSNGDIVLTGLTNLGFSAARLFGGPSATSIPTPINPRVGAITTQSQLVATGASLMVSAAFTFDNSSGPCTAIWSWGDGTTSAGTVAESTASGMVTGTHVYLAGGAFPVSLTVTDSRGTSGQSTIVPGILVRQPKAGSVNGNIRMNVPLGAVPSDPSLTASATMQFNTSFTTTGKPKGKVILKLKPAHLSFKSAAIDGLASSAKTIWLEGTGTVNSVEAVRFLASASVGAPGPGRIRLELWDAATGALVYDNQPGTPVDSPPTATIRGGTITFHFQHSQKKIGKGIRK